MTIGPDRRRRSQYRELLSHFGKKKYVARFRNILSSEPDPIFNF